MAITPLFYMGMLLITLKEKKYKKDFAEFDRMVMIYMEFVIFSLFAMPKVETPTVYIFISCILMPQNCIRSGKSCHMYTIYTMFSSSKIPFLHFIMALFMLGVPSLHHKHHVVLFIFIIFYLKQKI